MEAKNTNAEIENISVQRNYKDTVFRMIFKDKKELLTLYNAINDTHYDNVDDLEVKTLENAIYMNVKNDYSRFVELTREYERSYPFDDAINLAIDECIRRGILADFLKKNRAEVVSMSIFEYNAKLHEDTLRDDAREEGRIEGREEGEDRMSKLTKLLISENRLEDLTKAAQDKEYRNKLFLEYNL